MSFKSHAQGKELITNLYKAGDYVGFEPILENSSYQEAAVALKESEAIPIPKNDFLISVNTHSDVP